MSNVTQAKLNQDSNFFKDKSWLIFSCIIALMAGVIVLYFFQTHERVMDTPKYNLTPKATANRFLASEKLLQAEHKKVTITKGEVAKTALDNLWLQPIRQAKHNAVILYSVSKNQEASIPDMLRWVENGGHLVTFSQNTLVNYLSEEHMSNPKFVMGRQAQNKLDDYERGENILLNYLGIRNVYHSNGEWQKEASKARHVNQYLSPYEDIPSQAIFEKKVVMRLPIVSGNKIDENNRIEAVINTNTYAYLETGKFQKKYPNAKPLANYNWFTTTDKGASNSIPMLIEPKQTLLTANEQEQFNKYLINHHNKLESSITADEVMLDVKMGEGRLTIINSRDVFTNPNSMALETINSQKTQNDNKNVSSLWQQMTTPLTDNELTMIPENIASLDNAYLLKYLMAEREQIWIVPDIDVPSLPVMLWRSAKWACLAFLLLLAVGMLALPKRFGRIRAYQTDSERNIFGYFDHIGQYLWQTDEAKAIFSQNRTRLIEQIIAKQPHFAKLDPEQLCQAIAEQLNIGKSAVKQALYNDWHTTNQFLQCTRQFAVIRQAFS